MCCGVIYLDFPKAFLPFKQYRVLTVEMWSRDGDYDSSAHNGHESCTDVFVVLLSVLCIPGTSLI